MEKSALICAINSRQISRVFYFVVQHSISIIQAVLKRQVCITFYRGATDKRQLERKLVQLSTGLRQTRSFVGGNLCNFPPPGDRLNTPKIQGCTIFRQLLIGPIGFSSYLRCSTWLSDKKTQLFARSCAASFTSPLFLPIPPR